ncbi:CoA transferase [Neobacillus sp. BF23-41]|uniref:CoA transferase n=1 Tax=Neobacillus sp. BF23-41 TaxID=3240280 RepID=UPI0034E61412
MREMDPWIFENIKFNKRSIVLDLKSEKDREIVYCMVKHVEVVIEGFRPLVVQRLGIDYETLKKINPNIIYCSISGFGQTGP